MKFTIIYIPDSKETQELVEEKCKTLNEDFRNEYAGFLNFYHKIPESVRKRLPWDTIMEFRARAIILDSYSFRGMEEPGGAFELVMVFNDTTLESFSIIAPILEGMGAGVIRGLTRKALKRKVRKNLEAGGNVRIVKYWEGEE